MKTIIAVLLFLHPLWCWTQPTISYPATPQHPVLDTLWGKVITDPFRWLENIHNPEVEEWISKQEKLTTRYAKWKIARDPSVAKLSEVGYQPLVRQGHYYFQLSYANGGETQSLYGQTSTKQQPVLLFNPNRKGEKITAIDSYLLSPDDHTLALMLSVNGSDWRTTRFLDIKSRTLLSDELRFVKYSNIAWYGNGVFYIRYAANSAETAFEGNIGGRALYYHRLGTKQTEDPLIFKPTLSTDFFSFDVTQDQHFLAIYHTVPINGKLFNQLSAMNLTDSLNTTIVPVLTVADSRLSFEVVGAANDSLIVLTNLLAPKGQVLLFSTKEENHGQVLIPESNAMLTQLKLLDGKLLCLYSDSLREKFVVHKLNGELVGEWSIPSGYAVYDISGSATDSLAIYSFQSYYAPPTVYQVNLRTLSRRSIGKTLINYNYRQFNTIILTYKSKDSTEIPLYVTYKKGLQLNGNNPVLLYGYGGFGIPSKPFYDPANVAFLLRGGVLAVPAIRGGGDFPGWHEAGSRLNKQKSFDDFAAAAQYLIRMGFTNPNRLAIMGGSNGGLVVGAAITQHPELFKAAVAESGLFDMLRYHLYNIGYSYSAEYGSVADSSDFVNLLSYSPVQNVRKGVHYPAVLLVASDNDDRLSPFHSFKFLAELQAKGNGKNPYLLYYQHNAGHTGSDVFNAEVEKKAFVIGWIEAELDMNR